MHTATASFSLLGAAGGDRFYRQAGGLAARIVFQDARQPRVNHIFDAGNRQRCFGDIGGDNDFLLGGFGKDKSLLGTGQPCVQRQNQTGTFFRQQIAGFANVLLGGHENQNILVTALPL